MGFLDFFRRKPPAAAASSGSSDAPAPSRDRAAWRQKLLDHVRERHAARPIPPREAMDPLQAAMYAVEGGFLNTWLQQHGPRMLAERRMLLEGMGQASGQPIVVLHGDAPAVAAVLVLAGDHARTGEKGLVTLLDEDYRAFVRDNPEAREFDFHVSSWSRFVPAAAELVERARQMGKPVSTALSYYNHVNGTLWGPRHGLEVENLWSWDGTRLELVEEAIAHKRY